jgi:hypothetical protein
MPTSGFSGAASVSSVFAASNGWNLIPEVCNGGGDEGGRCSIDGLVLVPTKQGNPRSRSSATGAHIFATHGDPSRSPRAECVLTDEREVEESYSTSCS